MADKRRLTDAEMEAMMAAPSNSPETAGKTRISDAEMEALMGGNKPAAPSAAQTALEHYGNTMTLGYLPQLQAGFQKLGYAVNPTDLLLKAKGFDLQQNDPTYLQLRDENIARQKAGADANPTAAKVGTGLGLVNGLAFGTSGPAAAATLAQRLGHAAKVGAVMGGLANPGDVAGEENWTQLPQRAMNAGVGAAAAPVVQLGVEGVVAPAIKAAASLSAPMRSWAVNKAAQALGGAQRDIEHYKNIVTPDGKTIYQKLGEKALDDGILPWLGSPVRTQARLDPMIESAGEKYGKLLTGTQDEINALNAKNPFILNKPVKIEEAGKKVTLVPALKQSPLREVVTYGEPQIQKIDSPAFSALGVEGPSVPVMAVQRALERAGAPTEITPAIQYTPVKTVFDRKASVDAKKLASSLKKTDEYQTLKEPTLEPAKARIDTVLETLANKGEDVSLPDIWRTRRVIDDSIKWNKARPEMTADQDMLYRARSEIGDQMNNIVDRIAEMKGSPSVNALKDAGRELSYLQYMGKLVDKSAVRADANRSIGLTDTIVGAAGAAGAHSPQEALVKALKYGAANKFARTYGKPITARSANLLSEILGKTNELVPQTVLPAGYAAGQAIPVWKLMEQQ